MQDGEQNGKWLIETRIDNMIIVRDSLVFSTCYQILNLSTMTLNSTSGSFSIFKDGKPKPGIYKIQNIVSETYVDVEVHTREIHCRPASNLGDGRGLVRRVPLSAVHV